MSTENKEHLKSNYGLDYVGLGDHTNLVWNLAPAEYYEEIIKNGEGVLTDKYAIRVLTGKYTGRSPKDKFVVDDPTVHNDIDWGPINQPTSEEVFDRLHKKMLDYLKDKKLYVIDAFAGADADYRLPIRVVSEAAYHGLFSYNMFRQPTEEELKEHKPEFTVLAATNFHSDPVIDNTRTDIFVLVNFTKKLILIGGTMYSGEVKKGIFSVMNYLLPHKGVMPMHCSANINHKGETTIFFGLSGTGKTTLSADPNKTLIGDDEHGWSENGVFNFEGGCYAKTIHLSEEGEPMIYATTQMPGTILENVPLDISRKPDFDDNRYTENTRCSYPLDYIPNASKDALGGHPRNIVFLTADAFGVLPPISRLTPEQAMFHFISGYTAKVAGTERGVTEPQATFSACFGAPFMPMHPTVYAEMLAEKIRTYGSSVWLVNTGWTGGPYGVGKRMKLEYTRRMLSEAIAGELDNVEFITDPIFGVSVPVEVPGVPEEILIPRKTWHDKAAYDKKARELANMFVQNFEKYKEKASASVIEAGPVV